MVASKGEIVEELTRPVSKLVIVVGSLFILHLIAGRLPGIDAFLWEERGLTILETANFVLAAVGTVFLIKFGREVEPKIRNLLGGSVLEDAAHFIEQLIYLVAVVVAYELFSEVVLAVTEVEQRLYSFVFLLLALYPLGNIVINLYQNLDEYADHITETAVSHVEEEEDTPQGEEEKESEEE